MKQRASSAARATVGIAAGFAAAVAGAAWLAISGANQWVARASEPYRLASADHVTPRSVAIVPGMGIRNGRPLPLLRARLEVALTLHRSGKVERVLVSGKRAGAHDETAVMRDWLLTRGVPAEDILVDPHGYRTLDTMERAARLLGVRDAVVCTQTSHLPRAVFLARRAGIDAVGVAAEGDGQRVPVPLRERLAAVLAVLDTYLLRRGPGSLLPAGGEVALHHP